MNHAKFRITELLVFVSSCIWWTAFSLTEVYSCRRNAFIHLVRILIGVGNKSPSSLFKNMNQLSRSCRKYEIKMETLSNLVPQYIRVLKKQILYTAPTYKAIPSLRGKPQKMYWGTGLRAFYQFLVSLPLNTVLKRVNKFHTLKTNICKFLHYVDRASCNDSW
jgi:hypothetical protein